MNENKPKSIGLLNYFVIKMTCAMAGFGTFWFYILICHNVWLSLIVGLLTSACVSDALNVEDIIKKSERRRHHLK